MCPDIAMNKEICSELDSMSRPAHATYVQKVEEISAKLAGQLTQVGREVLQDQLKLLNMQLIS